MFVQFCKSIGLVYSIPMYVYSSYLSCLLAFRCHVASVILVLTLAERILLYLWIPRTKTTPSSLVYAHLPLICSLSAVSYLPCLISVCPWVHQAINSDSLGVHCRHPCGLCVKPRVMQLVGRYWLVVLLSVVNVVITLHVSVNWTCVMQDAEIRQRGGG